MKPLEVGDFVAGADGEVGILHTLKENGLYSVARKSVHAPFLGFGTFAHSSRGLNRVWPSRAIREKLMKEYALWRLSR